MWLPPESCFGLLFPLVGTGICIQPFHVRFACSRAPSSELEFIARCYAVGSWNISDIEGRATMFVLALPTE